MKNLFLIGCWFICDLFFSSLLHAESSTIKPNIELHLTAEEQSFLKTHPDIRIGVFEKAMPYGFRDEQGNYRGIAMEFVDYINAQLNIQMHTLKDLSWPQVVEGIKKREVDVALMVSYRKDREEFMSFTQGYLPGPLVIVRKKGNLKIHDERSLDGKVIAMIDGFASSSRIKKDHPTVIEYKVESGFDALFAVSTGKADAFIGVLGGVVDHLILANSFKQLEIAARYGTSNNMQRFGVRKDWPELVSIIDKVLSAMPAGKRQELFERWVSSKTAELILSLQIKERAEH